VNGYQFWHSSLSKVYHSDERCTTGDNIEDDYLVEGKGNRRLCKQCRRLGGQRDTRSLTQTGTTFDRIEPDGSTRKFLWGVATAGQQVEGAPTKSDWASFSASAFQVARVHKLGEIGGTEMQLEPPGEALGHWWRPYFEQDLDRALALGLTAYRLSVEWSRIEPTAPGWVTSWIAARTGKDTWQIAFDPPGKLTAPVFDANALARYQEMINAIRDRGMEPVVTLNHMALPDWVLTTPRKARLDDPGLYTNTTVVGDGGTPIDVFMDSPIEDAVFRGTLRGWETSATGAAFVQFVEQVVSTLTGVNWWLTFNEPIATMLGSCYLAGAWPPGFVGDGSRAMRAYANLIETHVAAYDAIHKIQPAAMVGCSQWFGAARRSPQTAFSAFFDGSNEAAKNQWVFFNNHFFLDAVVNGADALTKWTTATDASFDLSRKTPVSFRPEWAGHLDFMAVQYYRSVYIYHFAWLIFACPWMGGRFTLDYKRDPAGEPGVASRMSSDLGWTIEPVGLHEILTDVQSRYGLPIMITENGIGETQDRNRAPFIVAHLQMVLASIADGCDVLGYLHWTIADNWEWAFDYLPQARFGLFTVDRHAVGRPRHLTTGGLCLAAAAAASTAAGTSFAGDLLDVLQKRFGSIAPDGKGHVRQLRQPCGQWAATTDSGEDFELVLVPLQAGAWFGMAFESDTQEWLAMSAISWQRAAGGQAGVLSFRLPGKGGDRRFTSTTSAPSSAGPAMTGTMTDATGVSVPWVAVRRRLPGVYRSTALDPMAPSHLQLVRFEPKAAWTMAAAKGKEAWDVCADVVIDEVAGTVACTLPDGRAYKAALSGQDLVGTVGAAKWTASALADDVPFA
jgi:beta-glucosidase/6-phospho-beta-glucosidase/beta-galactosidase